jgi:hypothetical protein
MRQQGANASQSTVEQVAYQQLSDSSDWFVPRCAEYQMGATAQVNGPYLLG